MLRTFCALPILSALLVFSSGAAPAFATEAEPESVAVPEWAGRLTIGARGFLRYSLDLSDDGESFNEFDIDRLYLTTSWRQSPDVGFFHTLEAGDLRQAGERGGYFDVTTKTAYLEFRNVGTEGLTLQFGQITTSWVGWEDSIWGNRYAQKTPLDLFRYVSTADLGFAAQWTLPGGFGELRGGVYNGEGWKAEELGAGKDLDLRLTLTPFSSSEGLLSHLFLSGYVFRGTLDGESYGGDAHDMEGRIDVMAGYHEAGAFTIAGSFAVTETPVAEDPTLDPVAGQILSGTLRFCPGTLISGALAERTELFGALSLHDPNTGAGEDGEQNLMVGLSTRLAPGIVSALAFQQRSFEADGVPEEMRALLLMDAKL